MATAILEVNKLKKTFGGVTAISDLSFALSKGEILGLIGPNGSGKSTTVNVLAGVYPATSGDIDLNGQPIHKLAEYDRVQRGLARTFQTAQSFPEFTVREHVTIGANVTLTSHPIRSIFGRDRKSDEARQTTERIQQVLTLTGLDAIAEDKVATISTAERRFLMIATALASNPSVLLLDEPAAGLIASERDTLIHMIRAVRETGTSVLVIEHHMGLIMELCDRIVVLNFGSLIAEGSPAQIRSNQAVIDAYLGETA